MENILSIINKWKKFSNIYLAFSFILRGILSLITTKFLNTTKSLIKIDNVVFDLSFIILSGFFILFIFVFTSMFFYVKVTNIFNKFHKDYIVSDFSDDFVVINDNYYILNFYLYKEAICNKKLINLEDKIENQYIYVLYFSSKKIQIDEETFETLNFVREVKSKPILFISKEELENKKIEEKNLVIYESNNL